MLFVISINFRRVFTEDDKFSDEISFPHNPRSMVVKFYLVRFYFFTFSFIVVFCSAFCHFYLKNEIKSLLFYI